MSDSSDQVFSDPIETSTREGLPRTYRMRADKHYVDQLAASSAGHPVRMIPLHQLAGQAADAAPAMRPLIESIRLHGIVHPLIVRRRDSQYLVVAGRKRLLAAQTLQFTTVPCLVHDLSDTEAAALAAADNLRGTASSGNDRQSGIAGIDELIAAHLSSVRTCAEMCGRGDGLDRQALGLLKAHAWRASRLIDARNLVAGVLLPSSRNRSLASILDEIVDGFSTESRLSGVTMQADVREPVPSRGWNDRQLVAGLSGALLAVLPLVEDSIRPTITIDASSASDTEITIEITFSGTTAPHQRARDFDETSVGALAAKALADAHDGHLTFERLPQGNRLTIALRRRP